MDTSHSPSPPTQSSSHDKLSTDRSIRLARLCPESTDACGFSLVLETYNLDNCPPFCSLSYTWGSPMMSETDDENSQSIEIVTVRCGGFHLKITKNGFDFLEFAFKSRLFTSDETRDLGPELPIALRDRFRSEGSEHGPNHEPEKFPGYFWMDAICINQEDLGERSSQVSLMGDIYRSSSATLIWMGHEDPPAEATLIMQSLIPRFMTIWNTLDDPIGFFEQKDAFFRDPELVKMFGDDITSQWQTNWKAFCVFIIRIRWFSRGWVVQEAVLGSLARRETVVALFGSVSAPWYDLARFLAALTWCDWRRSLRSALNEDGAVSHLAPLFERTMQRVNCTVLVRDLIAASVGGWRSWLLDRDYKPISGTAKMYCIMYEVVLCMRLHIFTDLRDAIYGCLGLVAASVEGISQPFKADYSLPTAEVLTSASWLMVSNMPKLDLLSLRESEANRTRHDLPSWVPDLSSRFWPTPMQSFRKDLRPTDRGFDASRADSPCSSFSLTEDHVLTLVGAKVSLVSEVGPILHPYRCATIEFEWFLRLLVSRREEPHSPYDADDEALCRSLVADTLSDQLSGDDYPKVFRDWWAGHLAVRAQIIERKGEPNSETSPIQRLLGQLERNNSWLPAASVVMDMKSKLDCGASRPKTPIDASVVRLWYPRVFICTDDGRFGLVNPGVRTGDEVWILKGGRNPFLVRQRDNGTYQLLGEVFVHGIMFGEILTQEFEEQFEPISIS